MSWINARRRSPVAGYAALLLGLVLVATLYSTLTGHSAGAQSAPSQPGVAAGQALFQANCSSCHGLDAQGTSEAPSLVGVGRGGGVLPDVHRPDAGQGDRRGEHA